MGAQTRSRVGAAHVYAHLCADSHTVRELVIAARANPGISNAAALLTPHASALLTAVRLAHGDLEWSLEYWGNLTLLGCCAPIL